MKAASTTFLITGVWIVTQIVAHETISRADAKIDGAVACAFLNCQATAHRWPGHPIEAGTILAALFGSALLLMAARAFRTGRL